MTGYETAQDLSHFVAGQLSPSKRTFTLSVGRRPTGVWGDLAAQIFLQFWQFYLKLYLSFFENNQLSHGNTRCGGGGGRRICSLYKTRLTCVAVVGLRWLTLADVGLRWPSLAVIGCRGRVLAFISCHGPSTAFSGRV